MATPRLCAHRGCRTPLPPGAPSRQLYCTRYPGDSRCRWREYAARVREGKEPVPRRRPVVEDGARVRPAAIPRAATFGASDPPYPDRAHLYPGGVEVVPELHVPELVERFPDGWALATGSHSLRRVLACCPAGVRVLSWHRQHRPYGEHPRAWEPLIICGGRRQPDRTVPDALEAPVPTGPMSWEHPGKKPEAWWHWVFDWLGVEPGDAVVDLYPGSGGGALALASYLERARLRAAAPDQLALCELGRSAG